MSRAAAPVFLVLAVSVLASASAHEIPNARIDRSTQATVRPGILDIAYEVSLAELTLTRDLRALAGPLSGGDRQDWFERYGRTVGPLNARGFLVSVDGHALALRVRGFDLAVEEHPRYTFRFETDLPPSGVLAIHDTNYVSSEGTSRLAIRARDGVDMTGDELPSDVEEVPIRPLWQLSDEEERRTRRVEIRYSPAAPAPSAGIVGAGPARPSAPSNPNRLTRLLDRASRTSLAGLTLIAVVLGAAHAVQPGHGKTLVAASVLGERGSWMRGAVVALATTLTHTGSVMLVAVGLWWTRSARYGQIHVGLARAAGFVIAAIGLWRVGRHLAGYGEHDESPGRSLVGLGIAGGLVPCWDAVGLIVLAEAVGRLSLGVTLLIAFGVGMACVLVLVGAMAAKFREALFPFGASRLWERRLGVFSGLVLTTVGGYFLMM